MHDDGSSHGSFWLAGSDAGFGSTDEAVHVGVVLDDDEEHDGDLRADEEGGVVGHEEPGKDGKAERAKDGCQRYVAGDQQDECEKSDGSERGERRGDEEDAEAGGDALAAVEAEPDGKDVTEYGAE